MLTCTSAYGGEDGDESDAPIARISSPELTAAYQSQSFMNLRLLIYAHSWAPSVGGVETITMALAKGLAEWPKTHPEESVTVTLVTKTPAGGMDDSLIPFRVVRHPSLWSFIQLAYSSDVLHLAGPSFLPMLVGLSLRKPTVVEHHGYHSVCPNGLLFYWPDQKVCLGHFMAHHYGKCARCNSGSKGWSKSLFDMVLTFPRRWLTKTVTVNIVPTRHIGTRISLPETQLIYHGVPGPVTSVRTSATNRDGQPLCFGYVGRLVVEKGLTVVLHASRQLAAGGYNFRLKIIGDGPERQNLEKMTEEMGLSARVQFVGAVPGEKIPDLLTDVTAVLMSSICEDVAPLVAIEQMMQARLIIASDIGGLAEEVGGTGLKFPAGDVDALASCMRQVFEQPHLALEMGEKAKRRASEAFTEHRMVEGHLRLCQALVKH